MLFRIIILLILIEVAYGSLHLWRERRERLDPDSDKNLMREWLLRELEKDLLKDERRE